MAIEGFLAIGQTFEFVKMAGMLCQSTVAKLYAVLFSNHFRAANIIKKTPTFIVVLDKQIRKVCNVAGEVGIHLIVLKSLDSLPIRITQLNISGIFDRFKFSWYIIDIGTY